MTISNPLAKRRHEAANDRATSFGPDLRAWCDEQNRKRITQRMGRWYYLREVDGETIADTLTGCDGENVHRLLNNELPDFAGWPPARMEGYRRWLRGVAEAGLLQAK